MELRQLRYFVAVAEELHFGRAARRLHLSQPPLSQQIIALEREIGVQLFARTGRGVQLTTAGSRFLDHARGVLRQASQAVSSAQRASRGEIGELSIGFIGSLAFTYMPRVVQLFVRRYPGVTLLLNEQTIAEQVDALQDGRLQVGLLRPPVTAADLESETLLVEPFIVAIPSDHPLAAHRRISIRMMRGQPLIMVPGRFGLRYYSQVLGLFRRAGFEPTVVQEIRHLNAAIGMVSAGLGLTILPESLGVVQVPGVTYRPVTDRLEGPEIAIAWRRGDPSTALERFREVAREVIGAGSAGLRAALPAEVRGAPFDRPPSAPVAARSPRRARAGS
jgi:DNA-binding transcriptional LysR family regulator